MGDREGSSKNRVSDFGVPNEHKAEERQAGGEGLMWEGEGPALGFGRLQDPERKPRVSPDPTQSYRSLD